MNPNLQPYGVNLILQPSFHPPQVFHEIIAQNKVCLNILKFVGAWL